MLASRHFLPTAPRHPFIADRRCRRTVPVRCSQSLRVMLWAVSWVCLLLTAVSSVHAESPATTDNSTAATAEQIEYFENQIRPLLVEHCLECHGPAKQQGALRLDSRAALLQGNESGPAIRPGSPDESRLLQVLAYSNNDIQMPPAGKLPDEAIAKVRQWIEQGAAFPAEETAAGGSTTLTDPAQHWAWQPRQVVEPPPVQQAERCENAIDRWVLARLEADGFILAPEADRAVLVRRLFLDLTGLPPQFEDVEEFVHDDRPDAWNRLVDRLLASPAYGERWARHWLDVARYADTKGYVFTEEPRYPFAYTYRDYVISAMNADKPYDQFVTEQLAADQVETASDPTTLAALGFVTVGRRFLNNGHDIIDDRIDVVSRGLLGLTVGCARCHDHKYDPIPTADYYSLYGVFASIHEPAELPMIGAPTEQTAFEKYEAELKVREQAVQAHQATLVEEISRELRDKVGLYLEFSTAPGNASPQAAGKALLSGDPRPEGLKRWKAFLGQRSGPQDPVFGPWNELSALGPNALAARWNELRSAWESDPGSASGLNRLVQQALLMQSDATVTELAQRYGELFQSIDREWQAARAAHPEKTALDDPAAEQLRQVLYADGAPTRVTVETLQPLLNRAERNKQRELKKNVETWQATSPGAPPRAMVVRDNPQPMNPKVFIRGNPGRQGPETPRQFLQVVAGTSRQPFPADRSGRRELAAAIVDPRNPLTARVIVNRLWHHHFGRGLVGTPSDFGLRGERPSHPELLDHLAEELIQSGWSLKAIQRLIVTSATYRQSSADHPAARMADPENRTLWQFPRRRLELEAMRDGWLFVSNRLDQRLGGRPFDSLVAENSTRRTVYGLVNRNDLPGVFRAFDFADPDSSAASRPQTSVPQQALFGLNAPFVIARARELGTDAQSVSAEVASQIDWLFQRVLARVPTAQERQLANDFVESARNDQALSPLGQLAQGLLLTNEFLFVD
jgi:mono/diheme cytochrome c family protein